MTRTDCGPVMLFTAVANCVFSEARFPQALLRASRLRPEVGAVEPRALRHALLHIQVQSARCAHSLVLHAARHTRLHPRLLCPQQPRGASPRLTETQATPPTVHTPVLEPARSVRSPLVGMKIQKAFGEQEVESNKTEALFAGLALPTCPSTSPLYTITRRDCASSAYR